MKQSNDLTSRGGSRDAADVDWDQHIPEIYDELRNLARARMKKEQPGHVLQPTALVHEAFARMARSRKLDLRSRSHVFAVAALNMKRVLIDWARASDVRPEELQITLPEGVSDEAEHTISLTSMEQIFARLEEQHERPAKVARMKVFSSMKVQEIAEALDVSERTVKSDWSFARAWLRRELADEP